MASKTVKQYRVLVEELDSLLRDWTRGILDGDSEAKHVNAIQVLADHIRCATCQKLPADERNAADKLVSSADALLIRFFANRNVEYCFVIDHPKFGTIGGFDGDHWDIDHEAVKKSSSFVRRDWPTRIIARDVTTKRPVDLGEEK